MQQVELERPTESLPSIAASLRCRLLSRVAALERPLPDGPWAVVAKNGEVDAICVIKGEGSSPAMLELCFRPHLPEEEAELINFLKVVGTGHEREFYAPDPQVYITWPKGQVEALCRVRNQNISLPGAHLSVCFVGPHEDVVIGLGESMNQTETLDFAHHLKKAQRLLRPENPLAIYDLSPATED